MTSLSERPQNSIDLDSRHFRVGIIGVGHGLRVHKPASEFTGRATVIAACGQSNSSSGAFQAPGFEDLSCWQAICDSDDIDIVVVASPASSHRPILEYLSSSRKAVMIEKPAGIDLEAAKKIRSLLVSGNTQHAVGFQFRFEPALIALRDILSSGSLGQIERVDIRWLVGGTTARSRDWRWQDSRKDGGGVLLNFATHAIDYTSLLCGQPEHRHSLRFSNLVTERPAPGQKNRVLAVDAEDSASIHWRTTRGTECSLVVSNQSSANLGHSILVSGSDGCATVDWTPPFMPRNSRLRILRGNDAKEIPLVQFTNQHQDFDSRMLPTMALWNTFLDNLCNKDSHTLPTIDDAIIAHHLIEAH